MPVIPFLEYLEEHPATSGLAVELARVFVLRGRADLLAAPATRRIAS
jgi:hypothetical protein